VRAIAGRLAADCGSAPTRALSEERARALDDAFAEAAGVPVVVDAVERTTRAKVGHATGWPIVGWLGGIKADPARRLDLDLGADARQLSGRDRSGVPQAAQVQRARVDTEVRALADEVSAGLNQPWVDAVHRASVSRLDELGDRLDAALAATEVGASRTPAWAWLVRVVQWLLLAAAVAGLVWTGGLLGTGKLSDPDTPQVAGVALALVLLVGGLVLGVVLGLLCRLGVASVGRKRAELADRQLRSAVSEVSHELVVVPVDAELTAYTAVRSGLDRALA